MMEAQRQADISLQLIKRLVCRNGSQVKLFMVSQLIQSSNYKPENDSTT